MDNEDVIRERMEETRTSLSEKLETLEKQVTDTVQGASTNVAETVEAVKDTVEAVRDKVQETVDVVKDTVQDTVASVKGSVQDTINTVKDTVEEGWTAVRGMLDVTGMVEAYPWAMFGGSVAVGFVLERMLTASAPPRARTVAHQNRFLPPDHYSGEDLADSKRPASSLFPDMFKTFEPEIKRLKGLALGVLISSIRDVVVQRAPENLADKLSEIFESVSQKVGAETFAEGAAPDHGQGGHMGNGRRAESASRGS